MLARSTSSPYRDATSAKTAGSGAPAANRGDDVASAGAIGREAELPDLRGLLGTHRHVTLLGPGGIGKTRLALQTAAEAIDAFADGVFFVDLGMLRDPELMPGAVAISLGLREQPGEPIMHTVGQHLRPKALLSDTRPHKRCVGSHAQSTGPDHAVHRDEHGLRRHDQRTPRPSPTDHRGRIVGHLTARSRRVGMLVRASALPVKPDRRVLRQRWQPERPRRDR